MLAIFFFAFAMIGLSSGVSLTERPEVTSDSLLAKAYYSLGLFVIGGLDIGTPTGGPLYGRILLWVSFFGSPLLAASAFVEVILNAFDQQPWRLRNVKDHIVVAGSGDLTTSYLRVLRDHNPRVPVVVVDNFIEPLRELELKESFGAMVVHGDITHEFQLHELRLHRAKRVILLGSEDFVAFEAASKMLRLFPNLAGKLVTHCVSLRFLRAMQHTRIAQSSECFNSYNLAAKGLVKDTLLAHFEKTPGKDTVVLAGFGLFGQTILEELQALAPDHLGRIVLIDVEASRRVPVVEEQQRLQPVHQRSVLEGDISHPDVWQNLTEMVELDQGEPVIILGTGESANNLRTAIWIKEKYPNAMVFSRTNDVSEFAWEVARDHNLHNISIINLVEANLPRAWLS